MIDQALLSGESLRELARRKGLSASSLFRHKKNHLKTDTAEFSRGRQSMRGETISESNQVVQEVIDGVKQLKLINGACLELLGKARINEKPATLLRAVDRIQRQIELQSRLISKIQENQDVNLAGLPEWQEIRSVVLVALRPFPEAQRAVVEALKHVEM